MQYHDVQINNQYQRLTFSHSSIQALFKTLDSLKDFPIPPGELSIAFLDDLTISQIHNDFLHDPTPTDVITFSSNPDFDLAGEICVSVDHAIASSQNLKIPFSQELTLYLVHGWLHLTGLNDLTDEQKITMRAAEKLVMETLEKAGAIPDFHLL